MNFAHTEESPGPIYSVGAKQVASMKYDAKTNHFYGRTFRSVGGISAKDGKRKFYDDVLPTEWVNANIDPNFATFLKQQAKKKAKFIWIPAGDSKPDAIDSIAYDTSLPRIHFNQGDRKTCSTSSLASCLFSLGQEKIALSIEEFGKEYLNNPMNDPSRILKSLFVWAQSNLLEFNKNWIPKKLDITHFDLWKDECCQNPKLLQPIGSDGGVGDALTVMNRLIFYSNLRHALPLNAFNLEFCLGGVYEGILFGYELIPIVCNEKAKKKVKRIIVNGIKCHQTQAQQMPKLKNPHNFPK
jgi:hypothetical protein